MKGNPGDFVWIDLILEIIGFQEARKGFFDIPIDIIIVTLTYITQLLEFKLSCRLNQFLRLCIIFVGFIIDAVECYGIAICHQLIIHPLQRNTASFVSKNTYRIQSFFKCNGICLKINIDIKYFL
ncbi:Uncharacterised protein [Mycobacterium tuberculosis]|nr:Uncharacterised protein [Mycobacterium tuberculosis]